MCLEVIRQVPTAPEPYQTLAQIYDKINPEKSLQFDLIAAHLSPNDEDQWIRLGRLSENLKNFKQADTCYAKAILANPNNIHSHLKRIQFLESIGEMKLVTKAKFRALGYMTVEHVDFMIMFAKELALQYFTENEINKAKECLSMIFRKCPMNVTPELVNMMLEVLIKLKNYGNCLEILTQYFDITIEIEPDEQNENNIKIVSYNLPEKLLPDFHTKFIVCLIHLKAFNFIDTLLAPLLLDEDQVDENGDLYLDVAEALMEENRPHDALKLFLLLVKSNKYNLPAVWLREADCLRACEFYEQAIDSYKTVMRLVPDHLEVRYPLSEILIKLNRKREALSVLEQDEKYEELDPGILFKKCKLLRELKLFNRYWSSGLLLLSRHCYTIRNREEVFKLTSMQKADRKGGALKLLRTERGEDPLDSNVTFSETNEPSVEDEFNLFKELVHSCMRRKRFDLMQRFTFTALGSKKFRTNQKHVELIAIFSCIYNGDCYHGYNLVRDLVQHNLLSKKCWNIYNIMIQKSDDSRHNRFLMRLLARADVDMNLHILHANNCLLAGTYKYALSEYIALYRIREEPILAFLIGVTLFQMASQKFSAKKNHLIIQGIGFFNIYKKLRGPEGLQEVIYNIGRGYHQLGMLHVAIAYYKKVLTIDTRLGQENPIFDLKREAAFNLHLIYKNSGAYDLANMYLYKYIIV